MTDLASRLESLGDEQRLLFDELLATRPAAQRQAFWRDNAKTFYRIDAPVEARTTATSTGE